MVCVVAFPNLGWGTSFKPTFQVLKLQNPGFWFWHTAVTSANCNSVLALSPMTITDKLQRVLNSAARLITATGKFDRGGPPLSGTASPVVPCRLLRASLHGSWSPASAIRQSPSTHRSSRPSQHFRRSCFRHCGPNSLEFSA